MYMNKSIWGPKLWYIIHSIAYLYPEKDNAYIKYFYYELFKFIYYIIPCPSCQKNFLKHYKRNPIILNKITKKYIIDWTIDLHNQVNHKLHKRIFSKDKIINRHIDFRIFIWYIEYLGTEVLKGKKQVSVFSKFILLLSYIVPKGNYWRNIFNSKGIGKNLGRIHRVELRKRIKEVVKELFILEL